MAVDSNVAFINTDGALFPNNEAVNATGPSTTDGTEFVKTMIDNDMFGPQQALLDYAGLVPSGVAEAAGASQELEAMQKSFSHPGEAVNWYGEDDPAVVGSRVLLLHGQGVQVSVYPELTAAVYVGDVDNPSAPAFYRADDAAGTIRNIVGVYLILPDARNVYPDFKPEPVQAARVLNNGAATLTSESDAFIASVTRSALGQVDVVFTAGYYSITPSIVCQTERAGENLTVDVFAESAAGFSTIMKVANVSSDIDRDLNFHVERQSGDYKPFGSEFLEPGIRY